MAVPELLVLNCRPDKIDRAVALLLDDETVRGRMLGDYAEICPALGSELPVSATQRTAEILEEMLGEGSKEFRLTLPHKGSAIASRALGK